MNLNKINIHNHIMISSIFYEESVVTNFKTSSIFSLLPFSMVKLLFEVSSFRVKQRFCRANANIRVSVSVQLSKIARLSNAPPLPGWVDVDEVGLVAHGVGLDQVRHVRLVQHTDTFKQLLYNKTSFLISLMALRILQRTSKHLFSS